MPCPEAKRLFGEWSKTIDQRNFYHPNNKAAHGETHSRAKELRQELRAKSETQIEKADKHRQTCPLCRADTPEKELKEDPLDDWI